MFNDNRERITITVNTGTIEHSVSIPVRDVLAADGTINTTALHTIGKCLVRHLTDQINKRQGSHQR